MFPRRTWVNGRLTTGDNLATEMVCVYALHPAHFTRALILFLVVCTRGMIPLETLEASQLLPVCVCVCVQFRAVYNFVFSIGFMMNDVSNSSG